ncbi:MAG TPA: DUF4097 family beta strand repeat-containing protein, partial [Bacillota bacterium]
TQTADLFWTYWPLLPLALGVELIARAVLADRATKSGKTVVPFHVESGVTVVTVIVVVIGLVGAMLGPVSWSGFKLSGIRIGSINLSHASRNAVQDLTIGKEVKAVTIKNPVGKVRVKAGAAADQITVDATVTGNGTTQEEANRNAEATKVTTTVTGTLAEVTVTLPEDFAGLGINKFNLASVDLTVGLPEGLDVAVKNQFGEVEVATGRAVDIDNEFGKVTVHGFAGDAVVDNQFGEVTVEEGAGSVTVVNANGAVNISDVKGDVSARSSFGAVEVNDVGGKVEARTSNGSVHIRRPGKDVTARTSFGAIEIVDSRAEVTAETSNGAINLSTSYPVVGAYDLRTRFGAVNVSFPDSSKVAIHAETSFGNINTNLSGKISKEESRQSFDSALNGGGVQVTIKTSNGGVDLTAH